MISLLIQRLTVTYSSGSKADYNFATAPEEAAHPETGSKAASIRSETTVKPTKESKKGKAIASSGDFKVIPRGPLGRLLGRLFYKEVIDRTQFESKGYETLPRGRIARITALDGPLTDPWDAPSPAKPQESEQPPFPKDHYSDDQIFSENLIEVIWGFQARAADELTLERGQVLKVLRLWEDGWATGLMYPARAESLTDGEHKELFEGVVKAFPLTYVCLPQRRRKAIEMPQN